MKVTANVVTTDYIILINQLIKDKKYKAFVPHMFIQTVVAVHDILTERCDKFEENAKNRNKLTLTFFEFLKTANLFSLCFSYLNLQFFDAKFRV